MYAKSTENLDFSTTDATASNSRSATTPQELNKLWDASASDTRATLKIDQQQALLQLEALGYEALDNVYLRGFYKSDDPRKSDDKGRKANTLNWKEAEQWQQDGRGIYFVVNGGGHLDKDVTKCRAIFYEHDDLDISRQLYLWQQLGLPEPTFQVNTGGKSIHSYWVFDAPITPELWRRLQTDLLEFSDGDRSLKNPSRVMRLAGAWHISAAGANQSKIVTNSGKRYSYEALRATIPQQALLQQLQVVRVPVLEPLTTGNVPLYQCLSKDDRTLIDCGAGEGSRNSSGAKLARNLLGTAQRLQHLGHHYDGDPRQLFDSYCLRCSPSLDAKEADAIWRSAISSNPTATLTDNMLENCAKAWKRNMEKGLDQGSTKSGNTGGALDQAKTKAYYDRLRQDKPTQKNLWDVPVSHNGEIGYWKAVKLKTSDDLGLLDDQDNSGVEWVFIPYCNFDFQVEREIIDSEGGGLVLLLKRSLDTEEHRVIINSTDYTELPSFENALKRELGMGVVCNLSKPALKSLIHSRLQEYRINRQGKMYKRIECYGQQPDGTWVFKDRQYKHDGTRITEDASLWVFNNSLGKDDFIPCPELAEENPMALSLLMEASRSFFGADNFYQALLMMGWTVASMHSQELFSWNSSYPLFNASGEPGSCKTIAAETSLSLIGKNWGSAGMISRVSVSALYEHGSLTGSLPFIWDDPERKKENEELAKDWYNWRTRKVRGNSQTPRSPMGITSNHVFGGDQEATFTRFARVSFIKSKNGDKAAFQQLKQTMKIASGAFPDLLKLTPNMPEIEALEAEFLLHLPQAHARIAQSLAIVTWYAQSLVSLTGGAENIKKWVISNCCPAENDADHAGDSLKDFVDKLLLLESEAVVGAWNLKRDVIKNGQKYVAVYIGSAWKLVDKRYEPATYNERSLKDLVIKAGGLVREQVRFADNRDEQLAYNRALITANPEMPPNSPKTTNRKAWLIPAELFSLSETAETTELEGCNQPVTAETSCNQSPVARLQPYLATISAHETIPVTTVTKKIDLEEEEEMMSRDDLWINEEPVDEFLNVDENVEADFLVAAVAAVTGSNETAETIAVVGCNHVTKKTEQLVAPLVTSDLLVTAPTDSLKVGDNPLPTPYKVGQIIEVTHELSPYKGVVVKITQVKISGKSVTYQGTLQSARRREDRKRSNWLLSHDEVKLVNF